MSVISFALHGRVAVITINNPPVNALSQPVRAGIVQCLEQLAGDERVAACVLACAGRTFIAGADIREFGKPPEPPHLPDVVLALDAFPKPIVAALHGTALGGGLEVAMGCHYRVAADSARVGLPEVTLGLLPGAGGTQLLPRLVGAEAALDMMLSGKPIKAVRAAELGLVDDMVAADELLKSAVQLAGRKAAEKPRRTSQRSVPPVNTDLFVERRMQVSARSRGLISPLHIIDCVEAACVYGLERGMQKEREAFLECRNSPQSAGLRHAFFAERAAGKVAGLDPDTPTREIRRVVILGAGTMGAGIAHSCLSAGLQVRLLDRDADSVERGANTVRELFAGGVSRGKLSEADAEAHLARFETEANSEAVADADLVIEAVFEDMSVKREVFGRLGELCKTGAILATNTSTLDIDEIAAASGRAADVIGLHFFSPAHLMKLVEIVRGRETADDVLATSLSFAKKLGKLGVVVGNCYGFVGNRMLYSYGREAQLLLLEGATPQQVDRALTQWGMAMGPNAVGDLAGLDVGYKGRQQWADKPTDPRYYRVFDLLVEQGRLGQKTGRGVFLYPDGSRKPQTDPEVEQMIRNEAKRLGIEQRQVTDEEIVERCIYALVTEGARLLEEGIAQKSSDIDVIWLNGYGFPRHRGGPLHYADSVGLDQVYARVCEFNETLDGNFWEPPVLLAELAENGGRFADVGA